MRIANGCAELLEFKKRFKASDVVIVDGFDDGLEQDLDSDAVGYEEYWWWRGYLGERD